jgi:hypothetical protein
MPMKLIIITLTQRKVSIARPIYYYNHFLQSINGEQSTDTLFAKKLEIGQKYLAKWQDICYYE